ncbi:kelch-like protein diablo [Sycon ciliatum]|uniref:kelch-like protein diablo n=1 Tax=Sycon ciliatum TaxID=27933 RepID=UPI0031F6167B|eukprot:scpid22546/ scgid8590/ Kelch-like protein diablo
MDNIVSPTSVSVSSIHTGTTSTSSSTGLDGETGADAGVLAHALTILNDLCDLRSRSELCDVVLVASDDRTVSAHRAVLAAGTPYFRAMLTGGLKESAQSKISLPGVDGDTLEMLVNFLYTGRVQVDETNVQVLLTAASLLQLNSVMEICVKFLLTHIDTANCLGVVALGKVLALPTLYEGAMEFAARNFFSIVSSEDYLQVPVEILRELLTRDELVVRSETDVFDACIQWLRHEWPRHARLAAGVLHCVRWPCMPATSLACLDCDEELQFLRELPECATLLQYAKWGEWNAMGQRHKSWRRLRHSIACRGIVFAIGGETNPGRNIISDAEKFDSQVGSWEAVSPITKPRRGAGAVLVGNLLYMAGGSDGFNALSDIVSYEPETNVWSEAGEMLEKRSSVGAVAAGHTIYFIGGYDGQTTCLSSAESYHVQTRQHKILPPMTSPRSMCTVALLNDCIYAIGGYDGSDDLRSVERYEMEQGRWVSVAPMLEKRSMAASAVISDRLFVVGGSAGLVVFASAEVYDPNMDMWTMIADMNHARSGLGVAVISGSLYVLGGYNGVANLSSVESYDDDTHEWVLRPSMLVARRRFSCCCQVT